MRVVVGLHHLELGGSQLNALDLAVAMRERGHEMMIFGVCQREPGPMVDLARSAGLPVRLARHPLERTRWARPFRLSVSRRLMAVVREHRADLVHVYEYPLILDAFHGPHLRLGVPVVGTVYGMGVSKWVPRYPELIVGTGQIVEDTTRFRDRPTLIAPPVNLDGDDPTTMDGHSFRLVHGIADGELAVVVVSRLEPDMKAEGIRRAIDAFALLADPRLRLIVVGAGPSYDELADRAEKANATLGRPAVVFTGSLADPRPAYAAADVALGMGGSGLRAMAFGAPLVVLGVGGFSRIFAPESVDYFRREGAFGVGNGDLDPAPLAEQIASLAADAGRRQRLGAWSRQHIIDEYGLASAADKLAEVYGRALAENAGPGRRIRESLRAGAHRVGAEIVPTGLKARVRGWRG
jgi:glycosyltransferase involved in cell wall biosynthesis